MHLGIDFWLQNAPKWSHVGTKIEHKSMPTSNTKFFKKPYFSLGKTMILTIQGIENSIKNRIKNEVR